ncbi:MAG: efflux RND transporter periplasmic adaptor subunit [Alphaproteobacteria bacterium]|nr:efflux RND transporter periplasmic adaptor subunit [Alphaproteobacteria bacterium]
MKSLLLFATSCLLLSAAFGPPLLAADPPAKEQGEAKKADFKWTCPMHPHYIAEEFGACPICGMDLVKLDISGAAAGSSGGPDRPAIVVRPETLQTMGVRIAKAEQTSFGRIIRSFGLVAENERLQTEMSARTEAWIEDLRIRAVGDQVNKGDLLFSMYAPEFIVSQRDYLDALKGRSATRIRSIRTRLNAFGMQDRAIDELERTQEVMEFVPFYADRDGTVATIELRPGSYVQRGTMLTRIQDYSQVWLMVSVSEKDLGFIKASTPARVTFPNLPGREIFAKVEYVYPTVDPKTRTGQVRLVLDNKDGHLRPGAYADVAFEVGSEQRLAVPTESILNSGGVRYLIASLGEGRFEPRAVTTGLTSGRWTEVNGEIEPGDDIVVSGQFLIDSESALRESFHKLERLQLPLSLLKLDASQFAMVDHFIDAALYMHEAIVDGYDVEPKYLDPAVEVKTLLWPAFQHTKLAFVMEDAVKAIGMAQTAKTQSELHAALAGLVVALEPWVRTGAPGHYREKKVELLKDDGSGRLWLQLEGKPLNPYGNGSSTRIMLPETAASEPSATSAGTDAAASGAGLNSMPGHSH